MQVNLRVARFQRSKKIFVIADLQVGMQTALKQNPGAAKFEHFFDLRVDGFERQNVAILRAKRAVECAKRAVFRAEIRVVDVAVDLIGGDARIVFLHSQLMRGHADADEIIGLEHFERLLFSNSHGACP